MNTEYNKPIKVYVLSSIHQYEWIRNDNIFKIHKKKDRNPLNLDYDKTKAEYAIV